MEKMYLLGEEMVLSEGMQKYITICSHYEKLAEKLAIDFGKEISEKRLAGEGLRNLVDKYILIVAEDMLDQLSEYDIFTMTEKNIMDNYLPSVTGELYDYVYKFESRIQSACDEAQGQIDRAAYQRQMREQSRDIIRRTDARLFLMGATSLGSIIKSNVTRSLTENRSQIASESQIVGTLNNQVLRMEKNQELHTDLINLMYAAVVNTVEPLLNVIKAETDEKIEYVTQENADKSKGITNSITAGRVPEEKISKQLVNAWVLNPRNEKIYEILYNRYPKDFEAHDKLVSALGWNPAIYKAALFKQFADSHPYKELTNSEKFLLYTELQKMAIDLKVNLVEIFATLNMQSYLNALESAEQAERTYDGIQYDSIEAKTKAIEDINALDKKMEEYNLASDAEYSTFYKYVEHYDFSSVKLKNIYCKKYLEPKRNIALKVAEINSLIDNIETMNENELNRVRKKLKSYDKSIAREAQKKVANALKKIEIEKREKEERQIKEIKNQMAECKSMSVDEMISLKSKLASQYPEKIVKGYVEEIEKLIVERKTAQKISEIEKLMFNYKSMSDAELITLEERLASQYPEAIVKEYVDEVEKTRIEKIENEARQQKKQEFDLVREKVQSILPLVESHAQNIKNEFTDYRILEWEGDLDVIKGFTPILTVVCNSGISPKFWGDKYLVKSEASSILSCLSDFVYFITLDKFILYVRGERYEWNLNDIKDFSFKNGFFSSKLLVNLVSGEIKKIEIFWGFEKHVAGINEIISKVRSL